MVKAVKNLTLIFTSIMLILSTVQSAWASSSSIEDLYIPELEVIHLMNDHEIIDLVHKINMVDSQGVNRDGIKESWKPYSKEFHSPLVNRMLADLDKPKLKANFDVTISILHYANDPDPKMQKSVIKQHEALRKNNKKVIMLIMNEDGTYKLKGDKRFIKKITPNTKVKLILDQHGEQKPLINKSLKNVGQDLDTKLAFDYAVKINRKRVNASQFKNKIDDILNHFTKAHGLQNKLNIDFVSLYSCSVARNHHTGSHFTKKFSEEMLNSKWLKSAVVAGRVGNVDLSGMVQPTLELYKKLGQLNKAYYDAYMMNPLNSSRSPQSFVKANSKFMNTVQNLLDSEPFQELEADTQAFKSTLAQYNNTYQIYQNMKTLNIDIEDEKFKSIRQELFMHERDVLQQRNKLNNNTEAFDRLFNMTQRELIKQNLDKQSIFNRTLFEKLTLEHFDAAKEYYYNGDHLNKDDARSHINTNYKQRRQLYTAATNPNLHGSNLADVDENGRVVDTSKPAGSNKPSSTVNSNTTGLLDDFTNMMDNIADKFQNTFKGNDTPEVESVNLAATDDTVEISGRKKGGIKPFKVSLVEIGGVGMGVYGTYTGIKDSLEDQSAMDSAIDYMQRNNYQTNLAFNSTVAAVEGGLLGVEALSLFFAPALAGPVGWASMIVGAVAFPIPILLDRRAQRLSENKDIALHHHDLYSRTQAAKEKLLTEVVIPNAFKQGVLAFEQKDTSFTIEEIDLTNEQVKLVAKSSLHFTDAKHLKLYSAEEVLAKHAWNNTNRFRRKPGNSDIYVPSDKPYNTIEDINDDVDMDHFRHKTTPKTTLNGRIKTLFLPNFTREHVVFTGKKLNTKKHGHFTKNNFLGININQAFEQAMGYRGATHITKSVRLRDFIKSERKAGNKVGLTESMTPVVVHLPEHSMSLVQSLPKTGHVAHAEDFETVAYQLIGRNSDAVYHMTTDLFSKRVSVSFSEGRTYVTNRLTLKGDGHFVLVAADTSTAPFDVRPKNDDKPSSALKVRQNDRTWHVDARDLNEGSTIDFIVAHPEGQEGQDEIHSFVKQGSALVQRTEDQQERHLKALTAHLKQSGTSEIHNSLPEVEHKAIHNQALTLMLSNHAWEVGRVRVTLADATEFEVKLRNEATTELNLAYSVNEIASIQFNNTKTNEWLSQNKFTQAQLKDYVNASSKIAQLCVSLIQPHKGKMHSHLSPCSQRQKNLAKAGRKTVVSHSVAKLMANEYRYHHPGLKDSDYRTIDFWNESKNDAASFYVTATYELDGHIYPVALSTQVQKLSKTGRDKIDKAMNKSSFEDDSKIRLYVPKNATIKTFVLTAIKKNIIAERDLSGLITKTGNDNHHFSIQKGASDQQPSVYEHHIQTHSSFNSLAERARKDWKNAEDKLVNDINYADKWRQNMPGI